MAIVTHTNRSINRSDTASADQVWTALSATLSDFQTASGDDAAFICKVWINLDGTGTIAIRDDEGVSSVTDNGTGDYTITFDSAFANDDYCAVQGQSRANAASFNDNCWIQIAGQSTTYVRICTSRPADQTIVDHEIANVAIFGEV